MLHKNKEFQLENLKKPILNNQCVPKSYFKGSKNKWIKNGRLKINNIENLLYSITTYGRLMLVKRLMEFINQFNLMNINSSKGLHKYQWLHSTN